jgi:predicted DNA-binding transcriptional regulator AlpA
MEQLNLDKEFYSIDEVESIVGKNRGTIYNRIKLLNITKHKFPQDSKTYVAMDDVKRIKTVIEKPWMAEQLKNKPEQSERSSPVEGVA